MEERTYGLAGKLTPDQVESAKAYIDRVRAESRAPIERELPKTAEDLRFIRLANSFIRQELNDLGIEVVPEMPAEQVHILNTADFSAKYPQAFGGKEWLSNAVYVSERRTRAELYKTILHEMIHGVGYQKFLANPVKASIRPYRTGYMLHDRELDVTYFRGLNEAVIDRIVKELFDKHKKNVCELLSISEDVWGKIPFNYQREYMCVLESIVKKLAQHGMNPENEIWWAIKRGQFSGDMMHLRKIEETYGKKTLRILALLGASKAETDLLINKYFETDDVETRNQLSREILEAEEVGS